MMAVRGRHYSHGILISGVMLGLSAEPARANEADAVHLAAYNQLGLLEFCVGEGFADPTSVDTQKDLIRALALPEPEASLHEAYEKGRAGVLQTADIEQNLKKLPKAAGGIEVICHDLQTAMMAALAQLRS